MNDEQQGLNKLLTQIKMIPASRILVLAGVLCVVIFFVAWGRFLKPLTESVQSMRGKEVTEEEFTFLELVNVKTSADLEKAKERLKKKQEEVREIAKDKNIPVNPNVYAEVVAGVNNLLNVNYLKLLGFNEEKGVPVKLLANYVAQFSQRYTVRGDFSDLLGFLEEVNRLPYPCQISMLQLESLDLKDTQTLDKRILKMDFQLTLYYLQARDE
jgi:hypothetical protein